MGICRRCAEDRTRLRPGKLCVVCFFLPGCREAVAVEPDPRPHRGVCRHCQKERSIRGRGLCARDYRNRFTRAKYPPLKDCGGGRPVEPTDAELDALIESRRATMPPDKNHPPEVAHWQLPVIRMGRRWNRRNF